MSRKVILTRLLRGGLGGRFSNRHGHQLHSMKVNTGLLQSFSSQPGQLFIVKEDTFNTYGSILIPPGARISPPPPPKGTLKGVFGADWNARKTKLREWWDYVFKLMGGGFILNALKYFFLDRKKEIADEEDNVARAKMLNKISSEVTNLANQLEKLTTKVEKFNLKSEFETVEKQLGWIFGVLAAEIVILVVCLGVAFSPKK